MDDRPEIKKPETQSPQLANRQSEKNDGLNLNVGSNLNKERWTELCSQASVEKDPRKLLQLVTEINRLLAERQARLARGLRPDDGK
jgi:hypothetical protein